MGQIDQFQFVELIRAHFYIPFGASCGVRSCSAPKAPLPKGALGAAEHTKTDL